MHVRFSSFIEVMTKILNLDFQNCFIWIESGVVKRYICAPIYFEFDICLHNSHPLLRLGEAISFCDGTRGEPPPGKVLLRMILKWWPMKFCCSLLDFMNMKHQTWYIENLNLKSVWMPCWYRFEVQILTFSDNFTRFEKIYRLTIINYNFTIQ